MKDGRHDDALGSFQNSSQIPSHRPSLCRKSHALDISKSTINQIGTLESRFVGFTGFFLFRLFASLSFLIETLSIFKLRRLLRFVRIRTRRHRRTHLTLSIRSGRTAVPKNKLISHQLQRSTNHIHRFWTVTAASVILIADRQSVMTRTHRKVMLTRKSHLTSDRKKVSTEEQKPRAHKPLQLW